MSSVTALGAPLQLEQPGLAHALQGKPIHTSAAAAAAAVGSFSILLSPNVRGGPPTVLFGALATLLGMEALVAGAGAAPRVRP
jgi:hypothetical protein